MKLIVDEKKPVQSVLVITPTIGAPTLTDAVNSVQKQTYENVEHLLVLDGPDVILAGKVFAAIGAAGTGIHTLRTATIPFNVGAGGWYGHRIYAAFSYLFNHDAVVYLDEDNWFEPNHIQSLVDVVNTGAPWAHSLRKIYDVTGNFICEDNCESLGKQSAWTGEGVHLVDTSSYLLRREVAQTCGHAWFGQWGADRQFLREAWNKYPDFKSTGQHTLCYRLGGNEGSVQKEFFLNGNNEMVRRCQAAGISHFPWRLRKDSSFGMPEKA